MKKWFIAAPTFVFLIMILIGVVTPGLNQNLLGFGALCLAGYSFLAIFIDGLVLAFQGQSKLSLANRYLFGYLITVLILTLGITIYFMAHH